MKQLLLGNEAVARGIYEAGVKLVSSYPGTPSTEITETVSKYKEIYSEWAPNEKVAAEVAIGASIAGARSFCAMKHVGLNVAADPVYTASYTGVNGGFVLAVADDPGMHSSQNEQDSRHYAIASKIPMLEPSDSAESIAFVKEAYEISEIFADNAKELAKILAENPGLSLTDFLSGDKYFDGSKNNSKDATKFINENYNRNGTKKTAEQKLLLIKMENELIKLIII